MSGCRVDDWRLGRGAYRIDLVETGTGRLAWSGTGHTLAASFNRGEGVVSTAGLAVDLSRCGADCVGNVSPLSHELGFWRLDRPSEPAWIGPVETVEVVNQQWQITASDRMSWNAGAAAVRDYVAVAGGEVDAVEAFSTLLEYCREYRDAGLNVWFEGSPYRTPPLSGIPVEVRLLTGEPVWDEMDLLSRTSVDWSVVGPHLYWGAPAVPVVDGPVLTSDAWVTAPTPSIDGSRWASQVRVVGSAGLVAYWPEVDEIRRRMVTVNDPDIATQGQAIARAQEVYAHLQTPAVLISSGSSSLSERFPHPLHGLIPGRRYWVDLATSCLPIETALTELFQVEVTISTGPDGSHLEREVVADFRQPGRVSDAL